MASPKLDYAAPEQDAGGFHIALLQPDEERRPAFPFRSSVAVLEPGAVSRLDVHREREVWFVTEGAGELVYDGERHAVRSGDALYFEPFKSHELHNNGTAAIRIVSVWWD